MSVDPILHKRVTERDFVYHSPGEGDIPRFTVIRELAKKLAVTMLEHVPPGRELSTALTRLEEVVMHANAGIARGP